MYFGESQKLVRALFSMCRKLAPCILFIDEVDIFLSSRGRSDQEANQQIKSQFLQLWDGMLSEDIDNKYGIVVVGATYVLRWLALILFYGWIVDYMTIEKLQKAIFFVLLLILIT